MKDDLNFFDVFEELLQDVSDEAVENLVALFTQRIHPTAAMDHIETIRAAVKQEAQYRGIVPMQ